MELGPISSGADRTCPSAPMAPGTPLRTPTGNAQRCSSSSWSESLRYQARDSSARLCSISRPRPKPPPTAPGYQTTGGAVSGVLPAPVKTPSSTTSVVHEVLPRPLPATSLISRQVPPFITRYRGSTSTPKPPTSTSWNSRTVTAMGTSRPATFVVRQLSTDERSAIVSSGRRRSAFSSPRLSGRLFGMSTMSRQPWSRSTSASASSRKALRLVPSPSMLS